jgi:hypothetical protein
VDLSPSGSESDFYFVQADDPEAAVPRIIELVKSRIPKRFGSVGGISCRAWPTNYHTPPSARAGTIGHSGASTSYAAGRWRAPP